MNITFLFVPGQAPKLNTAPLVQLDTGGKYYKTMIDGMMFNFKKAVNKASERVFSLNNVTSIKPISVAGAGAGPLHQQQVTIQDIHIEGINGPKVSNVYVNKKNMKLHVTFNYKTIRVSGRCSTAHSSQQKPSSGANGQSPNSNKVLMEATNWSTSWSANVMPMIGRDHFDMNRVYTSHSQQRLSLNLKECPQAMHDKLKTALVDRVKTNIDSRLVEIMETVMIHTDTLSDDQPTSSLLAQTVRAQKPRERGKRASNGKTSGTGGRPTATTSKTSPKKPNPISSAIEANKKKSPVVMANGNPNGKIGDDQVGDTKSGANQQHQPQQQTKQKSLKRTKRQTPCQQGEELDDYVDQLFRFGTRIVRAMEPITLPNATIELPDYNLKIFLYDGKGTRAYKFRRTKAAWVFCSNETISLGITIEVEELRVAYKYRVISGNRLLFDGDLEARLSPKVQAQFSQAVQEEDSEEPVQQRIDRVRVFRLGRVQVIIRGLGNLTQSLSMIINSYLNDNQEELQPTFRMVEGDAVRFLNRMLANVNVPLLSVV